MRIIENLIKGKKLILFGAGTEGARTVVLELDNYDIAYFCDNDSDKWGKTFMGIPVNSPASLADEDPNKIVVIITTNIMYKHEIYIELVALYGIHAHDTSVFCVRETDTLFPKRYEQLRLHKLELDKVYNLLANDESKQRFNMLLENYKSGAIYYGNVKSKRKQYFNDIFCDCMEDSEVYIDVGVLNENTIIDFIEYTGNKYKKIYAFEAETANYNYLLGKFKNSSKKINIT